MKVFFQGFLSLRHLRITARIGEGDQARPSPVSSFGLRVVQTSHPKLQNWNVKFGPSWDPPVQALGVLREPEFRQMSFSRPGHGIPWHSPWHSPWHGPGLSWSRQDIWVDPLGHRRFLGGLGSPVRVGSWVLGMFLGPGGGQGILEAPPGDWNSHMDMDHWPMMWHGF